MLDPGRGRTKTGYLWALARDDRRWGGADPPGVVYFYEPGRGTGHAEAVLRGFAGTLQVDGYLPEGGVVLAANPGDEGEIAAALVRLVRDEPALKARLAALQAAGGLDFLRRHKIGMTYRDVLRSILSGTAREPLQ